MGLVFLGACDSVEAPDVCAEPLAVGRPLGEMVLTARGDTLVHDLEDTALPFTLSGRAALSYRATSTDSAVVEAETWGEKGRVLALIPRDPGTVTIRLTAWDACGRTAAQVFDVRVEPDCSGAVEVVQAPRDLTLYVDAPAERLDLAGDRLSFAHTAGGALTFAVESDATLVEATLQERVLLLNAVRPGEGLVVVTATDGCGRRARVEVPVRVHACPRPPAAGEADYFPVTVGQTWVFDYVQGRYGTGGSYRNLGTLTWEVAGQRACKAGRRTFVVHERFDGTEQVNTGPEGWVDRAPKTWQKQFEIVVGDSVRLGPYYTAPIPRFHPATAADTLAFDNGVSGAYFPAVSLRLVRDQGLVERSLFHHFSAGGYEDGLMTRRPGR